MDIRRLDRAAGMWAPQENPPRKATATGNPAAKDRVDLGKGSDTSRNPAVSITRLASASPVQREERIEEVKEKVESGFYNTPEAIEQVTDAMVDKGFVG